MVSVFEQAATRGGMIEPGRFRVIGDRLVFIDGRDRHGGLEGVMIADYSNPTRPLRIFAERGRLGFDSETGRLRFELFEGDVHVAPADPTQLADKRLDFEELAYAFDVGALLGRAFSPTRPRQMSLTELRAVLDRADAGDPLFGLDERDPVEYALEIQRRFALPLSPLLFSIAAVPLGVRMRRGGRAWGVLLAGVLVAAYYAMIGGGQALARAGLLAPAAGLWGPTGAFAALAAALVLRMRRGPTA
jgi:lipopolysaccharide export LptBFGC system permease protein LptF